MSQKGDIQQQLIEVFQAELQEHTRILNQGLLSLEKNLSAEEKRGLLAEVFRAAHSLKGAARAVGISDVETLAHSLENVLSDIQEERREPSSNLIDDLLPLVDGIDEAMVAYFMGEKLSQAYLDQLTGVLNVQPIEVDSHTPPETPPQPLNVSSQPSSDYTERTVRVSTAKLDSLMEDISELVTFQLRSEKHLQGLIEQQERYIQWVRDWRLVQSKVTGLTRGKNSKDVNQEDLKALIQFLDSNENLLHTAQTQQHDLSQAFSDDLKLLSLLVADFQDDLRRIRMQPIASLFEMMPRLVRDMARSQGKQVSLHVEGEDTEVDRQVIELIRDPLVHLLRNAMDHGIRPPGARIESGKSPTGNITLRASRQGNAIRIEVSDDGPGIDLHALKETAIRRGHLSREEGGSQNEQELLSMIFISGLSTHPGVSDLSGRGVGLDVVRENVERLQGVIQVENNPGKGVTFNLILPLTLSTSQVLLLQASGQTFGVHTTAVERILRLDSQAIFSLEGKPAIRYEDRPLPLVGLSQILNLQRSDRATNKDEWLQVVVLGAAEKRLAVMVDGFDRVQEVVVKDLGPQLHKVPYVSGSTILGTGEVVVILNISDLFKSTLSTNRILMPDLGKPEVVEKHRILVVDDSITTRTLVKNILQNAGFRVMTAANGQEAWALVQHQPVDIVVADVAMPLMDGFALTENIKKDPRTNHLPVILVTSLDTREHKIRGMEAGAEAYLVKSSFEQQNLLETIEGLIG